MNEFLKALTIFRAIDSIRRSTNDRHSRLFEALDQVQWCLAPELHDHTLGLFKLGNLYHVFKGERLEIQAIGDIEIRGYSFRIAVNHNGFIAICAQGQGGMHAAVIEFNALTYAIGPSPQHHDLVPGRRCSLAFFLIGGIHIGGGRSKFGGAGIDTFVDRPHAEGVARPLHFDFLDTEQL